MRSVLLSMMDRAVHRAMLRRAVASTLIPTALGGVHVYDAPGRGSAPTIVLLHRLSSAAGSYARMIARMRRRARRVVAPDFPGHGRSDEPAVELTPDRLFDTMTEVLDQVLGDEPCVVIGNSLGGAVAVEYAIRRPE